MDFMDNGKLLVRRLLAAGPEVRARLVAELDEAALTAFDADWPAWVHEGQAPPHDDAWRVWVMLGGRGFGKTRAGAEWVSEMARSRPACSGRPGRCRSRWWRRAWTRRDG